MFEKIRENRRIQLFFAFIIGIMFGFLLQKGGATDYEVIVNQLLLRDFTVLKIIFTAVLVGMIGVYLMKSLNMIDLKPKPADLKAIIIGGLIFGVGFALMGYCPGTTAGAIGTGSIHAIFGAVGMFLGAGFFAFIFPKVRESLYDKGLGNITFPELFGVNYWVVVLVFSVLIIGVLYIIERLGF